MGIMRGRTGISLSHFGGYQADVEQSARSLTGAALMMTASTAFSASRLGCLWKISVCVTGDYYYRDIQPSLRKNRHKEACRQTWNKVWAIDASVNLVPIKTEQHTNVPEALLGAWGLRCQARAERAVLASAALATTGRFAPGFQDNGVDVSSLRLDASLTSAVLIVQSDG